MELPQGFRERMSRLLGGEYPAFLASYDREISRGLRLNGWKSREGRREGFGEAGEAMGEPEGAAQGTGEAIKWRLS